MDENGGLGYNVAMSEMNPDVLEQLRAGNIVAGSRSDDPLNQIKHDWGTLMYAFNAMGFVSYVGISNDGTEILRGTDDIPLQGEKSSERTLEILADRMAELVQDSSPEQ
tara:strand:- start:22331 stop:22657 length:327 start_codon:yes stop_codon:yes gene_type:complete